MFTKEQIIKNLERQLEYYRYLYELERKRTNSIVDGLKIYLVFLSFFFGSLLFKAIDLTFIEQIIQYQSINIIYKIIILSLYCISALLLLISLGLSMYVLKPWNYERLSDPEFQLKTSTITQYDIEILMNYIADFAHITNRTNKINNKRAKLLSYSLSLLFLGVLVFLVSSMISQIVMVK